MAISGVTGVDRSRDDFQDRKGLRRWLQRNISRLVVAPSFAICLFFVYGYILWTVYISFTNSKLIPSYEFIGFEPYSKLWASERWTDVALVNLGIFAVLFIGIAMAVGLLLAILLDQRIRAEGFLRSVYLYPMALSFIVTGTAWKWILNPEFGIEKFAHDLGFENFVFDWLIQPDKAIYTIVIAGVWQSAGFVMALCLAGLRGIDSEIMKAAAIDGANLFRVYWRIIIPALRPVFLSAFVVLAHLAIKSFDLVVALTGGGPGFSSDLPATFMYAQTFQRNQIGVGAASAVIMMMTVMAIVIPYLYSELRGARRRG